MPTPTAPARLGRYQTRLSRIVDILASHPVTLPVPGQFGKSKTITIWTGLLYKSDGRTVDTIQEWEASGAFRNQRGVSSPLDLALFTRTLSDAELEAGRKRLPASALSATDAADAAAAEPAKDEPAQAAATEAAPIVDPVKDPRLAGHLAEIVWNTYQECVGDAIASGLLPRDTVVTSIRGPWAELAASTLVSYLDNPEPKPAAKEPPPLPHEVKPPAAEQPQEVKPPAADEKLADTGEVKLPGDDPEKPPA